MKKLMIVGLLSWSLSLTLHAGGGTGFIVTLLDLIQNTQKTFDEVASIDERMLTKLTEVFGELVKCKDDLSNKVLQEKNYDLLPYIIDALERIDARLEAIAENIAESDHKDAKSTAAILMQAADDLFGVINDVRVYKQQQDEMKKVEVKRVERVDESADSELAEALSSGFESVAAYRVFRDDLARQQRVGQQVLERKQVERKRAEVQRDDEEFRRAQLKPGAGDIKDVDRPSDVSLANELGISQQELQDAKRAAEQRDREKQERARAEIRDKAFRQRQRLMRGRASHARTQSQAIKIKQAQAR